MSFELQPLLQIVDHAITHPWLIHDIARPGQIVAELLPKLADEDPQILHVFLMCLAPHLGMQHPAGHDPPRVPCKHPEKFEFLAGKLERQALLSNLMGGYIDVKIADLNDGET